MNYPAELALHKYMDDAANNKSTISEEVIQQIGNDIMDALRRQFGEKEPRKFRLRMSNGDTSINGSYDIVINNAVDDIKSASDWSYRNKFESFGTLASGDGFGYIGQLAGYARASGKDVGGWWVVNKANGKFKYVPATGIDVEKEKDKIKQTVKIVEENKFERCFEPEVETFRKVETGNKVLNKHCTFCDFKKTCWPDLIERPQVKSQAKFPKMVSYIELKEEYRE